MPTGWSAVAQQAPSRLSLSNSCPLATEENPSGSRGSHRTLGRMRVRGFDGPALCSRGTLQTAFADPIGSRLVGESGAAESLPKKVINAGAAGVDCMRAIVALGFGLPTGWCAVAQQAPTRHSLSNSRPGGDQTPTSSRGVSVSGLTAWAAACFLELAAWTKPAIDNRTIKAKAAKQTVAARPARSPKMLKP